MNNVQLDYQTSSKKNISADDEKSIFLSICKKVSAVKSKTDIFMIINDVLKKPFPYDYCIISLANEDQQTHSAFLHDAEEIAAKYPGCEHLAAMKFPVNDGIFNTILNSEDVVVFELKDINKLPDASAYIQFWHEKGMKQLIGVPLRTGIKTIGTFSFYTQKPNIIPKDWFNLLSSICSQIAIAIQNATAHEQIEKKDFEKTVLLEISNDLALSKDKTDLIQVIESRLRKIIPFTHSAIGLIDHCRQAIDAFFIEPDHMTGFSGKQSVSCREIVLDPEKKQLIMEARDPVLFDVELLDSNHLLSAFIRGVNGSRTEKAALACLRDEHGILGFIALFSTKTDSFKIEELTLLKGIASQLSSAAGNILAKEDILKKEKEKTLLLSFSNHIATVRDINGLKFIIKQFLKKLFQIKEYIITIKNDDNSYGHFLHDLAVDEPKDEGFKIITSNKIPVKGSLTGAVLKSEEPIVFDISEILKQKKYTFPAASFWQAAGAKEILGTRLKVANEDIGILWIQPGQVNERLLKGISAQIGIALANATANSEVERQFQEIRRYKQQLLEENHYLQEEIDTNYNPNEIIGAGPEMQKVYQLMSQVSFSASTVLILGETGTGKELIARAIHNSSPRKDKLMVKVNCAALPINLIESELFGHERGSFTGAIEQKIGKFELANNSTLFLDEIGEMPLDLQVKFLRAVQEREIERVGGKKTIKVNVRIVAATNRNLQKEVLEGRFRSDLFYRLNVFPIVMPPLRKRIEDIPLLTSHFIKRLARSTGKHVDGIAQKPLQDLMAYNWPGNIRELEHLIERSLLLTNGNMIKQVQLPAGEKKEILRPAGEPDYKTIDENERDYIISILKVCNGKIFGTGGAAEILGIPPSTLNSKIRKLNIKKDRLFNI